MWKRVSRVSQLTWVGFAAAVTIFGSFDAWKRAEKVIELLPEFIQGRLLGLAMLVVGVFAFWGDAIFGWWKSRSDTEPQKPYESHSDEDIVAACSQLADKIEHNLCLIVARAPRPEPWDQILTVQSFEQDVLPDVLALQAEVRKRKRFRGFPQPHKIEKAYIPWFSKDVCSALRSVTVERQELVHRVGQATGKL